MCSLVVDVTNVISEEVVNKLRLKVEPYSEPYDLAWINNTKLRFT